MFTVQKYSFFFIPPSVFLNILLFVVFFMLFVGNPVLPSGFPSQTYFQYSTLSLLLLRHHKNSSHLSLLMVHRVGERIMTFFICPATFQINQVITHCLFPSLSSVRILFRHIAGAPHRQRVFSFMLIENRSKELFRGLTSITPTFFEGRCLLFFLPMDYQQTSRMFPSCFFFCLENS